LFVMLKEIIILHSNKKHTTGGGYEVIRWVSGGYIFNGLY